VSTPRSSPFPHIGDVSVDIAGRRTLRHRYLLLRQMVQMKSRVSGSPMETGVNPQQIAITQSGFMGLWVYFPELLANVDAVSAIPSVVAVESGVDHAIAEDRRTIIRVLRRDPLLAGRVRRPQTIPAAGRVTALSWASEMGDISRFRFDPTRDQLMWPLRR